MSGYIISLISASVIVALGGLVSYGGSTARVSRAAMAIVLLYTATLPIISVTGDISDLLSKDYFADLKVEYDQSDTLFYEHTEQAFGDGVRKFVCGEHGLDEGDVYVRVCELDLESMRAKKIIVILSGRAATSDARKIAGAVEDAGLGECEVIVDIGK